MAAAVPMGFLKPKPNPNHKPNSHHGHDQTMMRYRFQLFRPLIIRCESSRMASYQPLATYRVPSRMSLDRPSQNVSSLNSSKFRCSCSPISVDRNVTPFATAGFLSKFSFSWLNPLLKDGKEKVIDEKNIPKLRESDTAKLCYIAFMEKLAQQKQKNRSIASAIFIWQWKEIVVSGVFALIKALASTSGPILLGAFVKVVSRGSPSQQLKYALVACLFLAKCLESVAERQWSFWTRLVGVRVKSMLCAAIYQKQLRVPSTSYGSAGQIMNYVTVDAKRIGEFPYWFHQIWTTFVQILLGIGIVYYSVGPATFAALLVIALTVMGYSPLANLQHKYLTNLMGAQDKRLKSITEAVANMKVLKLYAWETHFKNMVGELREEESNWLSKILYQRGYYFILFWSSPAIVSIVTFWVCNFLRIPLNASNVFMFLATLRIIQQPIRLVPDIIAAFTEAKVAITRIEKFLEVPELYKRGSNGYQQQPGLSVLINSKRISWDHNSSKPTLADINLEIKNGEKVAICGEVGSGKSTLIAAILGEVPSISGRVHVNGEVAYVSQTAWIQTGSIQENILFGSRMDHERYLEVLAKCSLVKDMEMLPFGDQTGIGERGVNLSGGQKQRVQLARALYQDADVYLLDDPFSAVDAHTAAKLFKEYVMDSLSRKTVLLVTHQVDFLPEFDKVLVVSKGKILKAAPYDELLASCTEFQNLVLAHSETSHPDSEAVSNEPKEETEKILTINGANLGEQLIKKEAKETGDTGLRPYVQYLSQSNGFFYFFMSILVHLIYIIGQLVQNLWLATGVQGSSMNQSKLILVYIAISFVMSFFLFFRSYYIVILGVRSSKAIFSKFMTSLFRAPMSFYDSTPVGRIISRVSSDLSTVDLDLAFKLSLAVGTTMNTCFIFAIMTFLAWPVLFVVIPTVYITNRLQKYYLASAKELMRIEGTTKSSVASHLSESIAGAMTIRAFGEEDRFFSENLCLIDANASPFFHNFSAKEWLITRLELLCVMIVSTSALAMTLLPFDPSKSGLIAMALSYGLSLNTLLVNSVQTQCTLSNLIVSMERLEQQMHIPSEAAEVIEGSRPSKNWPSVGRVVLRDVKVRYQTNAPFVLKGISCIFEGGQKIGIVGRTGSGKTTLINVLFRLVEPTEGQVVVDDLDISSIGLHDLRSRFGIIPQEPTLFSGTVRYNLDPLGEHTDDELWKVIEKCHLGEVVRDKGEGLDAIVVQDGLNWSLGQRQLFCLGRALLKRRKLLVLDEATASIDNATDATIQKTIREEFVDCTVITVAHRIPTVMDCDMVLSISDGKLVEFDEPMNLLKKPGSLFGQLVKEYWSQNTSRQFE